MLAIQRSGFNTSHLQFWLWLSQQLSGSLDWQTNTFRLGRCQLCSHIPLIRFGTFPRPQHARIREKSLSPQRYQKLSAHNLNYSNGELQSWLILNTKLERDWFSSFFHTFYRLNRIESTGGNMKHNTFWAHFDERLYVLFPVVLQDQVWKVKSYQTYSGMWQKPNKQ